MQEEQIRIAALLAVHGFLLENLHANIFIREIDPQASLAVFRAEFLDRLRFKSWTQDGIDSDDLLRIQEESVQVAERFFDNVAAHISETAK
jgi:hypothetical protein